jgi:hypothetical protein
VRTKVNHSPYKAVHTRLKSRPRIMATIIIGGSSGAKEGFYGKFVRLCLILRLAAFLDRELHSMCMRAVPMLPSPSSRLKRLFGAFAMAVQVLFGLAGPLEEGRASRDTASHIEVAGVAAHYAHCENECNACIAFHTLAQPESRWSGVPHSDAAPRLQVSRAHDLPTRTGQSPHSTRAPPVLS